MANHSGGDRRRLGNNDGTEHGHIPARKQVPIRMEARTSCAFGVVIIMMIASSILRTLKARRLEQYCSECATAMGTKGLSHPEEFGAHKLRMRKG